MAGGSDFQLGQTVALPEGRIGRIHFIGNCHFAPGVWLGVELEDASGKNDGAVQGQRYFECKPGYGMFVKPSTAVVLDQPTPKPITTALARANGAVVKSRPQSLAFSGLRKQNILDLGTTRRQSINAGSPTPGRRGLPSSRLGSPSKSPTKQNDSTSSSSGKATPPFITNSTTPKASTSNNFARRPSIGPPSALSTNRRPSRQSVIGKMNGSSKAPGQIPSTISRAPTKNLSIRSGAASEKFGSVGGDSPVSASSGQRSPAEILAPAVSSPKIAQSKEDESAMTPGSMVSRKSVPNNTNSVDYSVRGRSPASSTQRGALAGTASSKEIDDLKTKLRIIEKRRIEDREKLKIMDRLQTERDKFEGIIQKLQSKYQPSQQEISDLRMQLKEEAARYTSLEARVAENESVLEEATVDKEMAEETAESLKMELDTLKQKHQDMTLEVEILREENEELGKEVGPEEKTSQGYLQMERSNGRLKEALLKLRDKTQQQETDFKNQVAELESDLQGMKSVKDENSQIKGKLAQSESAVDDLRQHLESVSGAEELIEELTSKNLELNEKIDSLKATIEGLEELKEVNDELEFNHTEAEKEMQVLIDRRDNIIAENGRKSAIKDETIRNLEYNVSRFRKVVTKMHDDLENMRASQQITESEANDMTSRSRAMMDLNMRLQVSASKAQVKAIDLELRKLEAQEAAEHLQIVQLFLPDTMKLGRISVLAYLSFKRLGFKADLIHGFIKERVGEQATPGHEEGILICCDILDKLVWISSTCNRFVQSIQRSTLEAFGQLEGALYELEPVERAINGWIDGLKRDEFREEQCAVEVQRSIALMTHLGEKHINQGLEQHADDIHMRSTMIKSYLENSAAALSQMKIFPQAKIPTSSEGGEDYQEMQDFLQKTGSLETQSRNAKVVASKAITQIQELRSRSLTLDPSTLSNIEKCQNSASELAYLTRSVGILLARLLNEEGRNTPFTYQEISLAISSSQSTSLSTISSKIQTTAAQIQSFYNTTSSLTQTVEIASPTPPTPWRLLAQHMHAESVALAIHKSEVGRLKDDLVEKNTALAIREKIVEEMSVKVEVLEKRVRESGAQRERVRELEAVVNTASEKEKSLFSQLKRQQFTLQELEGQREFWKMSTSPQNHPSPDLIRNEPPISGTNLAIGYRNAALESEIRGLKSSLRYLRAKCSSYNPYLSESPQSSLSILTTPQKTPRAPERLYRSEASCVLREALQVISSGENRLLKLRPSKREERLKWKPARESSPWVLAKQKGEWDVWSGWADSVARQRDGEWGMVYGVVREAELPVKPNLGGPEARCLSAGSWSGR